MTEQTAAIESAVMNAFNEYFECFAQIDPDTITEHFRTPLAAVGRGAMKVFTTTSDVQAMYISIWDRLAALEYRRSDVDRIDIVVLHDKLAILRATGSRFTAEGVAFESFDVAYAYTPDPDGGRWRISLITWV